MTLIPAVIQRIFLAEDTRACGERRLNHNDGEARLQVSSCSGLLIRPALLYFESQTLDVGWHCVLGIPIKRARYTIRAGTDVSMLRCPSVSY